MSTPAPAATEQIQKLLKGIGIEGWGGLDANSPAAKEAKDAQALQRYESARDVAAAFMTPAGGVALARLKERTTHYPSWKVDELGLINAVGYGIFREGQNSLVRWIEEQIEIAQQGPGGDAAPSRKRRRA